MASSDYAEYAEFMEFRRMKQRATAVPRDESITEGTVPRSQEGRIHSESRPEGRYESPSRPEGRYVPRSQEGRYGDNSRPEGRYGDNSRPEGRYVPRSQEGRYGDNSRPEGRYVPRSQEGRVGADSRPTNRVYETQPKSRPYVPPHSVPVITDGPQAIGEDELVSIPWSALTPSMPGLHIRTVHNACDCEDIAAALLANWGIPASITVYRRTELVQGAEGRQEAIIDRYGRPVHRHRWRRVDYDEDGEPVSVLMNVMTPYPVNGREQVSYDYEEERALAAEFARRLVAGKGEAGEGEAGEGEAGEAGASDADEAPAEAEKKDAAAKPLELPAMVGWGHSDIVHDGITYRPLGRNFAIVRMAKWYPNLKELRKSIIEGDTRAKLPVDASQTKAWGFFLCGLAHYNRDE
jgi:hypothetical protein